MSSAVLILLVADVLWQATKAIDRKLAEAGDPGLPNTDEARKRVRMRPR